MLLAGPSPLALGIARIGSPLALGEDEAAVAAKLRRPEVHAEPEYRRLALEAPPSDSLLADVRSLCTGERVHFATRGGQAGRVWARRQDSSPPASVAIKVDGLHQKPAP